MDEKSGGMDAHFQAAVNAHTLDDATLGRMEAGFADAEKQVNAEILKETTDHQLKLQELWKKMMDAYDENDPAMMEKLNQEWLGLMGNEMTESNFNDHWQAASDVEEMQYLNM